MLSDPMRGDEPVILVAGLLCLEKRVSFHRLQQLFSFDDETVASVSQELIIKRIAVEIDGVGLALAAGDLTQSDSSASALVEPSSARLPVQSVGNAEPGGTGSLLHTTAERRQLTVMFCDMADSTRLSTQLDPEDLREVLLAYQDLCCNVISKYQGFIARYMGDGILVYFGFPQAREKDAETAVRAGLEILENVTANHNNNREFAVRIGVATGPVVVGDLIGEGAAQEAAVVGETPNLAARLQSLAKPGELILSDLTKRLIGSTFTLRSMGLRPLKGIDEPVRVWLVSGESTIQSHVDRGALPLVGRQCELDQLVDCWQQAISGIGLSVLVKAEAGHGKSRLVSALCDAVQRSGCPIVTFRASPYHSTTALYPVVGFLKNMIDWELAGSDEQRLSRVATLARPLSDDHPRGVEILTSLLGLSANKDQSVTMMTPQVLREKTLDFLCDWLSDSRWSQAKLVIWEDLHWADATTIELFVLIQQRIVKRNLLSVGTHRPEFTLSNSETVSPKTVTLDRLDAPDIEAIVKNLAADRFIPDSMLCFIAEKCDGVPLFAEELTRGILDANLELTFEGATGSSPDIEIPETLQDSLMARLDSEPVQKEIAQIGSVLGREFSTKHIVALAPHDSKTIKQALAGLVDRNMLDVAGHNGNPCFVFKHALIRDAAYNSLLRKKRRSIHKLAAELYECEFEVTGHRQPELLAHHYAHSEDNPRKALVLWKESASLALARAADTEAVAHLQRALTEIDSLPSERETDELELEIRTMLAPPLSASFGVRDRLFKECIDRSEVLCDKLGDLPRKALLLRGKFGLEAQMGDMAIAHQHAIALETVAQKSGIRQLELGACASLSMTNLFLGDTEEAWRAADAGIKIYQSDWQSLEAWTLTQPGPQCYIWSSHALWLKGYPQQAMDRIEEAFGLLCDDEQSQYTRANMLMCGSWIPIWCGDYELAQTWAVKAELLSRRYGFDYYHRLNNCGLSYARFCTNPCTATVNDLAVAVETYVSVGYRPWAAAWYAYLGQCYLQLGDLTDAHQAIDRGFQVITNNNERWQESELHRIRGELINAEIWSPHLVNRKSFVETKLEKSLDVIGRGLRLAREQGSRSFELRALNSQLAILTQAVKQASELNGVFSQFQHVLAELVRCHGSFSEGLYTSDLQATADSISRAKMLLDASA